MRRFARGAGLALALLLAEGPFVCADAQSARPDVLDGSVSAMLDVLPDVGNAPGRQHATELRVRVLAERTQDVGAHLRLRGAVFVDGLVAARRDLGGTGATRAAIIRPNELYAEWRTERFDVRAGASRLVWGRLDEFQPGDVVNPLDTTRFLLDGRSEARLAVLMVRPRLFLPGGWVLEGVALPRYRSGRHDQLDETTSPFLLTGAGDAACPAGPASCVTLIPVRREPGTGWHTLQGGGRVTGTIGRVDVGGSIFRGFEPFGQLTLGPALPTFAPGPPVHNLFQTFPRFTMLAATSRPCRAPGACAAKRPGFPSTRCRQRHRRRPWPAVRSRLGLAWTARRAATA